MMEERGPWSHIDTVNSRNGIKTAKNGKQTTVNASN